MRLSFGLAALMVCVFVACQKEPDDSLVTPPVNNCKLDLIYYYGDDPVPVDTVNFEYNGNQVSMADYHDYYTELTYTGDRISRRNYYVPGMPDVAAFDEFTYNGDGTLSRVDFYIADQNLPTPVLLFRYTFSYQGGRLTQFTTSIDTSGTGPVPYLEYYYTYTGQNISEAFEVDLFNSTLDTLYYTYDANANYYQKVPALWLTDNLFTDFDGFLLPMALSANNVISIADRDGNSSAFTYTTTANDNIETLRFDGELVARYLYKCQ